MKKILIAFAVFLIFFSSSNAEERALVLTNSDSLQPYSFLDREGKPAGFFIDFWKLWSQRNKIPVKFKLVSWNESLELVKKGEADLHMGLILSSDRERYFDFTKLYGKVESGIFVSTRLKVERMSSLQAINIADLKGDYCNEFVSTVYPYLKMSLHETNEELFAKIANGEYLAFINDIPVAMHYMNRNNLMNDYSLFRKLYVQDIYCAVREGNIDLLNRIRSGIGNISEKEKEDLYSKWFYFEDELFTHDVKIIIVFSVAASVVLLLVLWFFSLKLQVKRKTRELRSALDEKDKLIRELTDSIQEIKKLQGLLPICAKCKSIRNDEGYWMEIESYIMKHTDADFSHTLCPSCVNELYPGLEVKGKK